MASGLTHTNFFFFTASGSVQFYFTDPDNSGQKGLDKHHYNPLLQVRSAAPSAQLTYSLRSRLERVERTDRRGIVSRLRDGCSPLFIGRKLSIGRVLPFPLSIYLSYLIFIICLSVYFHQITLYVLCMYLIFLNIFFVNFVCKKQFAINDPPNCLELSICLFRLPRRRVTQQRLPFPRSQSIQLSYIFFIISVHLSYRTFYLSIQLYLFFRLSRRAMSSQLSPL